jgi:pimeloyl-ACP methyl ester carboxylesterase
MMDSSEKAQPGAKAGVEAEIETEEQAAQQEPAKPRTLAQGSARVAIIWIPGLEATPNTAVDAIARRLAVALDRTSETVTAKLKVTDRIEQVERRPAGSFRRVTVLRQNGEREEAVVDIYELNYAETLTRPHVQSPALVRWLQVSRLAFLLFVLMLRGFVYRPGKTLIEKLQLLAGSVVLIGLVAYAWLLLAALVAAFEKLSGTSYISDYAGVLIEQLFGLVNLSPPSADIVGKIVAALLVITVGVGSGIPAIKSWIDRVGAETVSALAYLRVGNQRNAIVGRLAELIEHIGEEEPHYRRIDIIGNSFGTLVALDALFPHGRLPDTRFKLVCGLVTIGCPFDAVRTFVPEYVEGRYAAVDIRLNVYSPIDVLGSDFVEDPEAGVEGIVVSTDESERKRNQVPENIVFRRGQAEENLKFWDVLILLGFRAHAGYWSDIEEGERTAFVDIVPLLYRGDPLLT